MSGEIIGSVTLEFADPALLDHVNDPTERDISAAARAGETLFLSCDETAGIECLRPVGAGRWGAHRHVNLGDFFALPDGPGGEMDIEGLETVETAEGTWLWIVGSHALKRRKPKRDEHTASDALRRMGKLKRDPNRYFLGRVPLVRSSDGGLMPAAADGSRRAASLPLDADESVLVEMLAGDPLLAPFMELPSKENGFDIEGIAATAERVWLGLRGPVIRGHAVVVELALRPGDDAILRFGEPAPGQGYALHLLPAHGLGLRDLRRSGEDILCLTGPTLDAAGPAHVLRWKGALGTQGSGVVAEEALEELIAFPMQADGDKAEGLARWPEGGTDAWLVVHDDPVARRLDKAARTLEADIVRLTGT
ncbi:MAG: DUF3616 domain-containing protein [Pseudomonadota bacterium]